MAEKQTNKERLKDITDSIETGIKELFESDKYRQYLATMSRFHKYSVNNTMLIYMQRPDATHVAGFNKWRDQFGRSVKKGEKGIKIIAPTPFKKKIEQQKLDPDTRLPLRDENGDILMEEKTVQIPMYRPVVVFDVQQTVGKPLPELAANFTGNVQNYEVFMEALRRSSPVPICFEKLAENMDGCFSVDKQRIVLREGMSEVQTVCAAVHEITHSRLHNKDEIGEKYQEVELFDKPALFSNGRIDRDKLPEGLYCYDLRGSDDDPGMPVTLESHVTVNHAAAVITAAPIELPEQGFLYLGEDGLNFTGGEQTVKEFWHAQYPEKAKLSRAAEEIQAESISFAVCAYYGIETGENSFGYLATWAKDRDLTELRASLETINRASSALISDIDRHYAEICKERGLDKEPESLAAQPVQDIAVQEPEPVTAPDNGEVPDPAISAESMNAYGYTDADMLPLTKDRALELMERDVSVYMLHTDNTETMAFDAEEIRSFDGIFGVELSEWEAVKDRFAPPDYEKAFLSNPADSFAIYQLRDNDNTAQLRFMNAEYLAQKGLSIEKEKYAAVYAGGLDRRGDTQDRLDALYIAEAESVNYTPSAFSMSVPQADIDHILRMEGNADHARMKITTEFSKGKSVEEIAVFLQNTFHGGNGVVTENGRYSAWYAEDGIHIANGDATRYLTSAKVVSWQEAAEHIGQLLEHGEYAANVELAEAPGHERAELAQAVWHLRHDLSDKAVVQGSLSCLSDVRGGGFPEETVRLAERLADPAFREVLVDDFAQFRSDYQEDSSLLRFHYHKPDKIEQGLRELSLPRREYSTEMAEIPAVQRFITEDEIAAALTRGSNIADGKRRIYAYFKEKHSPKEQADFLKDEYGIGGRSHAVSGASHSSEEHSGKGISLKKQDCPEIQLNWANVAKRISELIRKDRFLTPEEKARFEQLRRQTAERSAAWNDYNAVKEAHPDDIVLYQVGDFFELYGEDAKQAAELLGLSLATRNILGAGRVEMCGFPMHILEKYVEELRDRYDVTISAKNENSPERHTYTLRSVDHEAETSIDAQEAEFGADGTRVFRDLAAEQAQPTVKELFGRYRLSVGNALSHDEAFLNACRNSDRQNAYLEGSNAIRRIIGATGDLQLMRLYYDNTAFHNRLHQELLDELYPTLATTITPSPYKVTQEDIDAALQKWNGKVESKHAVVRYMEQHGREKETAAWLAHEYGAGDSTKPLQISMGSSEPVILSWSKVQRRIAQLINADKFYTEEDRDNYDDIDPVAIREALAQRGIVGGEVVEPEKLDNDPFIQRVMQDAEQISAQEKPTLDPADRFHVVSLDRGFRTLYAVWDDETHGYYVDADGVTEEFTSEWQAEAYRLELQGQAEQALMERAKGLISDFCRSEYGSEADFSDPEKIGIAYTTVTDDEIPIQVNIDLENYRLERYLNDEHLETRQYGSLQELIANELENLDFSDLIHVSDEDVEQHRRHAPEEAVAEAPETAPAPQREPLPYSVGDTVYLEDGKPFIIESIGLFDISLRDPSLRYPVFRAESRESFARLMEQYPQPERAPAYTEETVAVYPGDKNNLPYDVEIRTLRFDEPEPPAFDNVMDVNPISVHVGGEWQTFTNREAAEKAMYDEYKDNLRRNAENFRITDDELGVGGAKAKFRANMAAINLLKELEFEGLQATSEQQEVLSRYVGWGGLADAFDESKDNWKDEFAELYAALSPEEYAAARASTLNAHYTSPTVIRAIYDAVENIGFRTGNILEPSMGVGNFFGMLPESMKSSRLYGVELDSITGRIAKQLYPKADITVAGFETTDRKDFYDLAVGNVPFGQYQVSDRAFDKLGFSIHNYFFAKALEQVRPGGVVAFVTSRYTMDAKDSAARKYIAQRANFLGAIRLPNNAFKANAGTEVVSDIIFLQKRDRPIEIEPDWVHTGIWRNPGENADGFAVNQYFIDHPEMVLGRQTSESTQYGRQDFTVVPIDGANLAEQLNGAIRNIRGTYTEAELPDLGEDEAIVATIPADPNVRNFSYTVVDGELYYRQNSIMTKPDFNATAKERAKGMVELRDCVHKLIFQQMDGFISDETIRQTQTELNTLYDSFTAKYGLINSRANALAFAEDSSYYLLCSLEELDEDKNLKRKADMFTRRTIRAHEAVTSVDTASEALALSISEKACVDMEYMSKLTGKDEDALASDLRGVIFRNPENMHWETADEYLSGNVREKLRIAQSAQNLFEGDYAGNVEALQAAQPRDLDASEIEVRLGATWIDPSYIREFMWETFETPFYQQRMIDVTYSAFTAEWNIKNKNAVSSNSIAAYMTYGTDRANAYKILEDTLNLRDVRIYDTKCDADGRERRVLNSKETTLAQQKQQAIRDAFRDWIWRDPDRRHTLVTRYNELFNSTRPREYDGSHITFAGMNPEIRLREHQLNAVAHVLYGGNTLLAHEVGAGKTFEMVAAAMESKRLGLCHKSLFVVPNHLTEQWSGEFLRLYPSANILVATKKDFEPKNRKKFCARIATGEYDAVIIGHSQFEKIPVSMERQQRLLAEQIFEVEEGLRELKSQRAERFTIKSLERTKRGLEAKLKKLQDSSRKDDVVTFEQLGVDRLYVDEAHNYKNLFLYTKMRNVAGLSATDAQKSSDMLLKCRYIDEITDSRGVVFATGTPVSNSMTELYTMMRYLQHNIIRSKGLAHFDCWASTFGETQTAIELAPEGTGYRARTRFAKFFNLPVTIYLSRKSCSQQRAETSRCLSC